VNEPAAGPYALANGIRGNVVADEYALNMCPGGCVAANIPKALVYIIDERPSFSTSVNTTQTSRCPQRERGSERETNLSYNQGAA